MTKSEWSGWVQAMGAFLAILASAFLVYFQMRRAERIREATAARRIISLVSRSGLTLDPALALSPDKPMQAAGLITPGLLLDE